MCHSSRTTLACLGRRHTAFRKPAGEGYGLTFMIEQYKGARLVGHSGSIPYFHSRFYMIPDAGVAVIAVANCMAGFQGIINTIFDQLLGLENQAIIDQIAAGLTAALIHASDRVSVWHVPLHQA